MTVPESGTQSESGRRSTGRAESGRPLRTVLIALLVVSTMPLAGCIGGGGGGKSWHVGGEEVPSTVESKLEVRPSTIFARVADIMGANASYPSIQGTSERSRFQLNRKTWLLESLVGSPVEANATGAELASYYSPQGNVILFNEHRLHEMGATALEMELAARFAQAIMIENGWLELSEFRGARTLAAQRIVLEAYTNEYNGSAHLASGLYDVQEATNTEQVWQTINYQYVYDWINARIDAPSELKSVLQGAMPNTSEQYLHGTDDLPRNLSIDINPGVSWVSIAGAEMRFGEAQIRWMLETQLDRSTAVAAAEGWGNDVMNRISSVSNSSKVGIWTLTWDSKADADEFASAMQTYITKRSSEVEDVSFEFRRMAPDTTVVLVGPEPALAALEIGYTNGTVTATI